MIILNSIGIFIIEKSYVYVPAIPIPNALIAQQVCQGVAIVPNIYVLDTCILHG